MTDTTTDRIRRSYEDLMGATVALQVQATAREEEFGERVALAATPAELTALNDLNEELNTFARAAGHLHRAQRDLQQALEALEALR